MRSAHVIHGCRGTLVAIALGMLLGPGRACAAQYTIGWNSIYPAGTTLSGGGWSMSATAGQPAGLLAGGPYTLIGGFWAARGGAYSVGVANEPPSGAPVSWGIDAPSPNPLIDRSIVRFALPQEQIVRVRVYDIHGRVARRLTEASLPAGFHDCVWDGTDDGGRRVGPGIYMLSVEAGPWRAQRKIAVLR